MKQNNLNYLFGVYDASSDSIIVNNGNKTSIIISCKECNSSVIFLELEDIAYLYRLAQESPLLYAELSLKENGLQDYVDAMEWFN